MGGNSSTPNRESTRNYYTPVDDSRYINCSPRVERSDINDVIKSLKLPEKDRKLMQEAKMLLAQESDWIFQDCEIRVVGDGVDYIFYSGSPSNVFVISEKNGKVNSICKSKSLRHELRNGGRSVWSYVSNHAEDLLGLVTGIGAKLALTFF